ncbi:hypothetical protein SEA_ENGINEER_165 [Gordonia Phage Engineer]|nr:hypothetical protein SEA_ENGINEER_165 [Gordonia Phage Engineer]
MSGENKPYMRKMQEIRRSNAATPIPSRKRRRRGSRSTDRRADIQEDRGK